MRGGFDEEQSCNTNRRDGGQNERYPDMDDSLTVELELPRDLLGALEVTEQELEAELKRLIALELFREERISSGKAARGAAGPLEGQVC